MDNKSKSYWLAQIYDSLSGNIDEDKAKALEDWRLQSAEHQAFYEEAQLFFDMVDFGVAPKDSEMEAAYRQFLHMQRSHVQPWYRRLWPYAAVAAGLVIAFFGGMHLTKRTAIHEGGQTTISVDKGSRSRTVLPDGTAIWLNSATKIQVDHDFGAKARKITMQGEAYFDVAHDPQRPFIIETPTLQVKVHGTSFNLSCYPEEDTRVALLEGSVELISDRGQSVLLRPQETAIYRAATGAFHMSKEPLHEEYGWRDSKYVFKDRKFGHIAAQLERMFDVEIHVTDRKILDKRFTGDFVNNEGLNEMLDIMAKVGEFSYRIKGRQIQIY